MPRTRQAERTSQSPHADAERRMQRLRAEIAEINRDLTVEQNEALAKRWADAVRSRLAKRVLDLRNLY